MEGDRERCATSVAEIARLVGKGSAGRPSEWIAAALKRLQRVRNTAAVLYRRPMSRTFVKNDGSKTERALGLFPFESADFLVGFESSEDVEVRVDLTLGGTVRVSTTVPPKGFAFAACDGFMVPTMCIDYHSVVPSVSPPGGRVISVYALVDDKTRAAFQRHGTWSDLGDRTLRFGAGDMRGGVRMAPSGEEASGVPLPDMRTLVVRGWFQ